MNKNTRFLIAGVSVVLVLTLVLFNGFREPELNKREKYNKLVAQEMIRFLDNADVEEVSVDHPYLASIQEYISTLDPELMTVPKERLKKAYEEAKYLSNKNSSRDITQWIGTEANMGGRTRALVFDPNDSNGNKVWAGAVTGGLWYNEDVTDEYSSWVVVDDFWADLSVSSIAFDPNNTQTIYVGTGEAETAIITYRASSGLGMGVMKSEDGGTTWSELSSTEGFAYITDVQVRDEDGQSVIYIGVASGKYMGEQHQSSPSDGLYRSEDGGASWDQVLPDIPGFNIPYMPSDIEIGQDGRIYVGTMPNLDEEGAAIILFSDIGLAGTWTAIDDFKNIIESEPDDNMPGRVILESAASDENIIYAAIASGLYSYGLPQYRCHHIVRSDDKGVSWSILNTPIGNWATIAWHALDLGVDPNNPDTIIAGGLDLHKSTDAGTTWVKISDWMSMYSGGGDDYVHGDIHTILFKENSSQESIISTDGGVFYTADASISSPIFVERNKSYNTLQCYAGAISPITDEIEYLSGHQDNGTVVWHDDPVTINEMISGGDGCYCFIDENEPGIWITSYQNNRYYIFQDGVQTSYITAYASGDFVCATDYDYKQNIIYSNAAFFWDYNLDKIVRLSGIPDAPAGQFIVLPTGGSTFSHVKYSPYSELSTTLFLGTQDGKVFRVDDADTNPDVTEIGSPDFPTATVSCIAVGQDENSLLVTFSNYGVSSVWYTEDGGINWEDKEGNLPDMPVRWALFNPDDDAYTLLATEIGVWSTNNIYDDNVFWEPVNEGLANVRVDMLRLRNSDNTILAVTHGRGLFTANYYCPTSISEQLDINVDVYPNPTQNFLNIQIRETENKVSTILINDSNGKEVYRNNTIKQKSKNPIKIDVSDLNSGVYFVEIHSSDKKKTIKIIKQ